MIPLNALTALGTHVLAAQDIPDPNDVKPGWLGFVVVVMLGVAVVVLLLSFRKQLRKVNFAEPRDEGSEDGSRAEGGRGAEDGAQGEGAEPNGGGRRNGGPEQA